MLFANLKVIDPGKESVVDLSTAERGCSSMSDDDNNIEKRMCLK